MVEPTNLIPQTKICMSVLWVLTHIVLDLPDVDPHTNVHIGDTMVYVSSFSLLAASLANF
jgi:hypothetical protein